MVQMVQPVTSLDWWCKMQIRFVCTGCQTQLGTLVKEVITQEDKDMYEASVGCGTCELEGCTVEDVEE